MIARQDTHGSPASRPAVAIFRNKRLLGKRCEKPLSLFPGLPISRYAP